MKEFVSSHHPIIRTGLKTNPSNNINQYYGIFCLKCINGIKGTKPSGIQWNIILETVNKWLPDVNFSKIYAPFFTDPSVPSAVTVLKKA